jgi:hypothetical protein
MTHHALGFLDN